MTITREFTKEQLQQIIETDHVQCGDASALARIALASLEAEAVPYERVAFEAFMADKFGDTIDHRRAKNGDQGYMAWDMLVAWIAWQRRAAMQGKAEPVSQDKLAFDNQVLSDLYHAQEKRLFKIAQRIKGPAFDKYAYSPSQAIDVLEAAIFGDSEVDHASMIAAAPQQEVKNV
ncbi:hypothetical protein [Citrobacter braakii]|uniref:hypothetical protein n=1 Tax=Citrobacter braakii TaxID=57706 RepID=UPI000907C02D